MLRLKRLVFGHTDFPESEEFRRFQFQFLCIVLLAGVICTVLLILGVETGLNPISPQHTFSMYCFSGISILLLLALRGHPERFPLVAWGYEMLCLLEYSSALIFVPEDEMRVIWFFTNVPGVYILLGQRPGLAITALTVIGLAIGNPYLPKPYSPNAIATTLLAIAYVGVFFHLYGNRSISYFVRMRESNRQLRHLASHDTLTGLLNARAYYASCEQMIHLAKRNNTPYTVLFVDLDHFKAINDTYGHAAGDTVLKSVAETLSCNVRQSDAVGRIGGEEFSVFLPNTTLSGAFTLAESIRLKIESLKLSIDQQELKITASIGVASNQHSEQSILEIQRMADQAMYLAKSRGRNRVSTLETQEDTAVV